MVKRVIWIVVVCALVPLAGFVAGSGMLRATQWLTQEPPRRDGDFAAFGEALERLERLLRRASAETAAR